VPSRDDLSQLTTTCMLGGCRYLELFQSTGKVTSDAIFQQIREGKLRELINILTTLQSFVLSYWSISENDIDFTLKFVRCEMFCNIKKLVFFV
jgi:hypothetical protein